jgi:hypothetical protein
MTLHGIASFASGHADLLLYLVPSIALAVLIHVLTSTHPLFFVLNLPGTLCHELCHFCVGLVTGAAPSSLTIVPRRTGRGWDLGSVTLMRVRWYNAAPAALAPVMLLAIPVAVAWYRTRPGWHFAPLDLALAFLLAPQFLSFWPSASDWRLAMRSWPYLLLAGACLYVSLNPSLFQFVTSFRADLFPK